MLEINRNYSKFLISALALAGAIAALATGTTRPASAAELVVNGSFEQGSVFDATGWTLGGTGSFIGLGFFRTGVRSWGSVAPTNSLATISQTITGLAAGQSATISFWVANSPGPVSNGLDVSVGGLSLFNLRNQPAGSSSPGTFTNYTTTFVSPSTAPLLLFSGFNGPGAIYVDDVSITVADVPTGVPEPSAVVGVVAVGALVAGSSWKKRSRNG